jgi:O-antigen/teichoic acid export membrane protein
MSQAETQPAPSFFRDALHGISFYAMPSLLRIPISMVLVPIYTRVLTTTDYGVLELLDITASLVGILLGGNLGIALFYYYSRAKNDWEKRQALWTACIAAFVLGLLVLALLVPFAPKISAMAFGRGANYVWAVQLLLGNLALSLQVDMIFMCLRATDRPRDYAVISVCRLVLTALLNIVFVAWLRSGYIGMLWSTIIVQGLFFVFLAAAYRKAFFGNFSLRLLWQYLVYSWPLDIASLATLTLTMGDRYILRHYVSLAQIGIYSLAYKFGFLISTASLIFNMYWKPKMFSLVQQPGGDHYYTRTQTYYNTALVWLAVMLSTALLPVIRIGTGKDFHEATAYIPLFAVAYSIRAVGEFNRNALYLAKKTSIEAGVTWLGCILALSGYLLFIPRFGLKGGVLSAAGVYVVLYFIGTALATRYRPIPMEKRRLALVWVSGLTCIAVYHLVAPATLLTQLLLGSACSLAFPVSLRILGFLTAGETDLLRRIYLRLPFAPKPTN